MKQIEQCQDAPIEDLLGALDVIARQLATAEPPNIWSLALQEFLALCCARRGLVITRREGAAARVAVAREISEDVAERFTREPHFWAAPPDSTFVLVDGHHAGTAGEQESLQTFMPRLRAVGIAWYTWLPLTLPEREEAVLVALGEGTRPSAAQWDRARLAGAVLGELVIGALERARLRELLARQERARDEFIGLASHELKSPLTVIKGYSQLLLRQARRANSAETANLEGLEAISHQVGRMSTLVGELLDFSRIERGTLEIEPAPVDVVALVGRVVEQRQRALPDVQFSFSSREAELIAVADRVRLEQVLGYLLDNAVKFGQNGGVVEVQVQRSPTMLPPPPVSPMAEGTGMPAQDEIALITVRDFGPGLPEEELPKLFTPFYRGPENSFQRQLAGLGLGLYLSHYLVTRQKGRLWAKSSTAQNAPGTMLYLALPLAPAA